MTRKITLAAARIQQGKQDKLYLGNLSSLRDWGYAKDYVECMWLILQNKDRRISSSPPACSTACGSSASWPSTMRASSWNSRARGWRKRAIDKATRPGAGGGQPDFYRPTDVVNLWGDPTKARTQLGWNPTKTSFEELVRIMVEHDMQKVAVERAEERIRCNLEEYLEKGVVK